MTVVEVTTFECLVDIERPRRAGTWWRETYTGSSEEIAAALEGLATRMLADPRVQAADPDDMCRFEGESYFPDGHPLHFFGGVQLVRRLPWDLKAHAAAIRQTAVTGPDPAGWTRHRPCQHPTTNSAGSPGTGCARCCPLSSRSRTRCRCRAKARTRSVSTGTRASPRPPTTSATRSNPQRPVAGRSRHMGG